MSKKQFSTSHPKILEFFNKYPHLNFESLILNFIEISEKLSQSLNEPINNSNVSNLLQNIQLINNKISSLEDNFNNYQSLSNQNLSLKLNEFKKDYIEDLKLHLTANTSEKIQPLIEKQTTLIYEKTTNLINSYFPNNNESLKKNIDESFSKLQKSLNYDIQNFEKNTLNSSTLNSFISSLEDKISNTLSNSNQIINNSINSSEKRLDSRLELIREKTESSFQTNINLNSSVSTLVNKLENSSSKGKMSENVLINILHSIYPSAQIDYVGQEKETGDVILCRKNKPKILIENKDWNKNVGKDEVKKFLHDIDIQKICGIFLSQNFGIANKENFEINIHDGNVLIYIHQVNNDPDKIKLAVDIIDHFKHNLDEFNKDTNLDQISKEKLQLINMEFQSFTSSKLNLIKLSKEFSSKFNKQIDDFKMPILEEYLSSRYASASSQFTCEYCGFSAKNSASKSAHLRGCSVKKDMENKKSGTFINIDASVSPIN